MLYKNLSHAFLFELFLGFISIPLIITVGQWGVVPLAMLALRPFLFERVVGPPSERLWRLSYDAFRISLLLTGGSVILMYIGFELELLRVEHQRLTFLLILSWFYVAHGFAGFMLSKTFDDSNKYLS